MVLFCFPCSGLFRASGYWSRIFPVFLLYLSLLFIHYTIIFCHLFIIRKGSLYLSSLSSREPFPLLIPSVLTDSTLQGFLECAGSTSELLVKHFKWAGLPRPPELNYPSICREWAWLSAGVWKAVILPKVPWFDPVDLMVISSLWCYWLNLVWEANIVPLYGHPPSDVCFHQSVLLFTNLATYSAWRFNTINTEVILGQIKIKSPLCHG